LGGNSGQGLVANDSMVHELQNAPTLAPKLRQVLEVFQIWFHDETRDGVGKGGGGGGGGLGGFTRPPAFGLSSEANLRGGAATNRSRRGATSKNRAGQ
jgi:hypothetical protein